MDRRLLFPAVAVTAWAQQASPEAANAEKALRARVEQFYQLQVDKKFRQAESLVAEDSKDAYYNGAKPDIKGFEIGKIELINGNSEAKVFVRTHQTMLFPGAGPVPIEVGNSSRWKIEQGQWTWMVDPESIGQTPFGKMSGETAGAGDKMDRTGEAPPVGDLMNQISVDRSAIVLTADAPVQVVKFSNGLPGPVSIELDAHSKTIKGLTVEASKLQLESGENAAITFRRSADAKISDTIRITAWPMGKFFDIAVASK